MTQSAKTYSAVVVDDEVLARNTLRQLFVEVPWLRCVGEAEDGESALRLIEREQPDVAFLDVRLPKLSGIEVLERLTHRPIVAFSTAYDEYAIRALQLGAAEYFLKPFGRLRFIEGTGRILQRLTNDAPRDDVQRLVEVSRYDRPLTRLFVRRGPLIAPVELAAVEVVKSEGDFVRLYHGSAQDLASIALSDLFPLLAANRFRRVHRSYVLNVDHIVSMAPFDARRVIATMRCGARIVASRSGSQELRALVF